MPPKVTLVHAATRAEARADVAKHLGAAAAAALGDNFQLGSPSDVVQSNTCFGGGYNTESNLWGGIVADQGGSSDKAYGAYAQYPMRYTGGGPTVASWTGVGGTYGTDLVQDGADQTTSGNNLWYEFFPNPANYVAHRAANGATIYTDVSETSTTSHYWQMFIEDLS